MPDDARPGLGYESWETDDDEEWPAVSRPPEVAKPPRKLSRDEKRLDALSDAIALFPEAASNYVLRGEVYLKIGEPDLAAADFTEALRLAEAQFGASDWGLVAQAARDQALEGLRRARRRQRR